MSELNLILLGPPGAGKGTQAARLRGDFDLPYIATGDLLREHVSNESELGSKAKQYMDEGALVPDDLVIEMILEKIGAEGQDGFLLDGFPRTVAQADALEPFLRRLECPGSAPAGQQQRQGDVLDGGERGQQVEELEYEADARAPQQ